MAINNNNDSKNDIDFVIASDFNPKPLGTPKQSLHKINKRDPNTCVLFIGNDEFDEYAEIPSSANQLYLSYLVNFGSCFDFVSYNPLNNQFKVNEHKQLLSKTLLFRYSLIEKIRNCDIIGIVCATLVIDNYLSIISLLKRTIQKQGKKAYLFNISKVNPAKLGNFSEIDIFVLITCPLSFQYLLPVHQQSYFKNIVTPFDLMMALGNDSEYLWTGMYTTDFNEILSHSFKMGAEKEMNVNESENVNAVAIKGKAGDLVKKDAKDFMNEKRTWKGVEYVNDELPPAVVQKGDTGIASLYQSDIL